MQLCQLLHRPRAANLLYVGKPPAAHWAARRARGARDGRLQVSRASALCRCLRAARHHDQAVAAAQPSPQARQASSRARRPSRASPAHSGEVAPARAAVVPVGLAPANWPVRLKVKCDDFATAPCTLGEKEPKLAAYSFA